MCIVFGSALDGLDVDSGAVDIDGRIDIEIIPTDGARSSKCAARVGRARTHVDDFGFVEGVEGGRIGVESGIFNVDQILIVDIVDGNGGGGVNAFFARLDRNR